MSRRTPPAWLGPVLFLVSASLALAALLYRASGGAEIADDAPYLLRLVRAPLLLWGDLGDLDLPVTWRSYPPLLPALFGLAVQPWLALFSDFVAIRLGALGWTLAALAGLWQLAGIEGASARERSRALWIYALTPAALAAVALIPQEESYVSLFALAVYAAARSGRFVAMAALFALCVLAGKLFLLALVVPLSLASPTPWREALRGGLAAGAALAAVLGYHALRFGSVPLLGFELDAATSISAWSLLVNLGVPLSPGAVRIGSLVSTGLLVVGFAWLARRSALPLLHSVAATLWLVLLSISISMAPYVLWGLPFTALAAARARSAGLRLACIGLLIGWSGLAYLAKLLRGVQLTLEMPRPAGKGAIAEAVIAVVGGDFPFAAARTATIAGVVIADLAVVALLWKAGRREASEHRSAG